MSEFLNYVPVEGSIGELLCNCINSLRIVGCTLICIYGVYRFICAIKELAEG